MDISHLREGDSVYVITRNPHTQSVAEIQEASVTEHPDHPGRLVMFLFEEYFPLTDDSAIFTTEEEAQKMYNVYFGDETLQCDWQI
ncbi:transcriptional regulator [Evansella sp. LMS18]|uniref:transcriptional regulator SplA domain-containing protein n=1 Tax=Evansella sp. LMS18 TaxID=2924033 RepID=UPI0020D10B69|nr:transcriptional regulator SplA domain-containing protein [Evansella sp. LMS18]UTR09178.1 transcriptional regulator [Evansella sp. LMS18]